MYAIRSYYARPYLAATIGGTHISPASTTYDSDTFWSFSSYNFV